MDAGGVVNLVGNLREAKACIKHREHQREGDYEGDVISPRFHCPAPLVLLVRDVMRIMGSQGERGHTFTVFKDKATRVHCQ